MITEKTAPQVKGFTSAVAGVNGVKLAYRIGGQGYPVVLLHGWPYLRRDLILSIDHFIVITGLSN